uniref:Uncharacterized protein n=1 Tax=Mycena chlorophos TaxID=658473 RepID=A0ABQ0KUB2_MYCCL|nr:predicted protein [Mycena chlorophos]
MDRSSASIYSSTELEFEAVVEPKLREGDASELKAGVLSSNCQYSCSWSYPTPRMPPATANPLAGSPSRRPPRVVLAA